MKGLEKQVGIWMIPKCIGIYYWHVCQRREYLHGIHKIKTKPNVVKKAINPLISAKKKIDTVNKIDKSQASNKTVDTLRRNKTEKVK